MAWLISPEKNGGYGSYMIAWNEGKKIRKRSTGTKDRKEAEKILKTWNAKETEAKALVLSNRKTFLDVGMECIADPVWNKRKVKSESTLKKYKEHINRFAEFATDYLDTSILYITDITPVVISAFFEWCKESIYVESRGIDKTRYAMGTANLIMQRVQTIMRYAHEKGYADTTTLQKELRQAKYTGTDIERAGGLKPVRAFSTDELNKILDTARELNPHVELCVMGMLCLGCRVSELGSATWDRVDMQAGTINLTDAKGKFIKTVPISNTFRPYIDKAYADKEKFGDDHIFRYPDGSAFDGQENHINRLRSVVMRNIFEPLGINSGATLHSFRYTFIQNNLRAGVNFRAIMLWAGHKRIDTFEKYLRQFLPDHDDINKMNYSFLSPQA